MARGLVRPCQRGQPGSDAVAARPSFFRVHTGKRARIKKQALFLIAEARRRGAVFAIKTACAPGSQPRPGSIIARTTPLADPKQAATARISRHGREGISYPLDRPLMPPTPA